MSEKSTTTVTLVAVLTHDATTGEIEQQRIIDHQSHDARVWLGKHSFWALRNGKAISTCPVKNVDNLPSWLIVE